MDTPFHKPALFAGHEFAAFQGGEDPAEVSAIAHSTAHALLFQIDHRADAQTLDKVVRFTDEHGIDTLAELWSHSSAHSLPGALWRMYLVRELIYVQSENISVYFAQGKEILSTADEVITGAPTPAGPQEMRELADTILRGAFTGDFSDALDRCAAFCRVTAAGATALAQDADVIDSERAHTLTRQALRLTNTAAELSVCARLWRDGALD